MPGEIICDQIKWLQKCFYQRKSTWAIVELFNFVQLNLLILCSFMACYCFHIFSDWCHIFPFF
uniref:Uncharacterized protein n=1 Tax=Rhizophora mucronata TaxID=61149 RepID=A0A2P2NRU2_RHIMU